MGCTVREKSIRTSRKFRPNLNSDSIVDDLVVDDNSKSVKTPDISDQNEEGENSRCPRLDESDWDYYTEDQLEDLLLKNLEFLYSEALCKIISLGYDEDTAVKSILRNGHSYGGSDVLSNILHNSLAYLNSNGNVNGDKSELVFGDLKQLEEYSLAGMLCLIQQVRPQLSRGDAMWCLLMSDLHVGRASTLEIPVLHPSCNDDREMLNNTQCWNQHSLSTRGVSVPVPIRPTLGLSGISGPCKFHGGWSLGDGSLPVTDVSIPKTALTGIGPPPQSFNISHSKKLSVIKRNAAAKFAARFQVDPKAETQVEGCPSSSSITFCADQIRKTGTEVLMDNGMTLVKQDSEAFCETKGHEPIVTAASELFPCLTTESKISTEQFEESKDSRNLDVVSSILGSLGSVNLDGKSEGGDDQRNRMIINLMHQIRVLEVQLKERIDWAHQKAMQAARKLSSDLTELRMLRMEREETLRLKKGKQALEDTTMKRLSDMENSLRKASGQVDHANAAVRRLETENAEIRAEMEASKLSASESVTTCLEVAKREKKYLKKLLAWEKQKGKFQDEIAEEKQKIAQLQQQLHLIKEAQKETEGKWKQEIKATELAVAQAEEERRAKEAGEVAIKRRQEAMRRKIDIDFQRHKDDIQRLEQELSRLKASAETSQLKCSSNTLCTGDATAKALKETNARMLHELQKLQEPSQKEANCDRDCLLCKKDEVSVVFLPCAHQILCINCNKDHEKQSKTSCPACSVRIEQRVHVYGASS